MQALRNPALEKVEKKLTGKTKEPAIEKRSSVKDKLQTMSFAQKTGVLTFLQSSVAWNELLKRATRTTTGRAEV